MVLAISLRQKVSSESKAVKGKEEVDREPDKRRKNAPLAVKKGGWVAKEQLKPFRGQTIVAIKGNTTASVILFWENRLSMFTHD